MIKNPIKRVELGIFNLSSNELRCTDPCYDVEEWCGGTLKALPGSWASHTIQSDEKLWGIRTAELHAIHLDYLDKELQYKETNIYGAVDSGQFGFFDKEKYPKITGNAKYKDEEFEAFYDRVCNLTCDMNGKGGRRDGGVIEFGCVSSSGYGDGGYPVFAAYNEDGIVVAVRAEFISDENNE